MEMEAFFSSTVGVLIAEIGDKRNYSLCFSPRVSRKNMPLSWAFLWQLYSIMRYRLIFLGVWLTQTVSPAMLQCWWEAVLLRWVYGC